MESPLADPLPNTEEEQPEFYEKDKGSAQIHGQIFEYKFCALSFLRFKNKGYKFKLASNMKGHGKFDDVVVEYLTENYRKSHIFLQLKSKLGHKITMQQLLEGKGDFSLRKYCKTYIEIEEKFNCSEEGVQVDGGIDESLFIIYTNADVEQKLKSNKVIDVSQAEFLMTSDTVLQFNEEEHKAIYEHLQDLPKHREFLSRFRIFYSQANEEEMDWHIKRELQQSMKIPDSELDLTYTVFLPIIQKWWQNCNYFLKETNSEENDPLRKTTEKVRTTLVAKILDQRKSELDDLSIKYKQSAITDMQQIIEPHKAVLIFAPGRSTTLTAAKIHQILSDKEHIILNLQQLIRYKTEVILAWKSRFDVLVLESQSSNENLQDVFNEMSTIMNECGVGKKLIFIVHRMGNTEQISALRSTFSTRLTEEYDDWKFTDIITESKAFFLEKKIIFQGSELHIKDIVKESDIRMLNALDGNSMSLLLGDEKPSIGIPIEETMGYYIERALECIQYVKPGAQNGSKLLPLVRRDSMEELKCISAFTENKHKISDYAQGIIQMSLASENEQEPTRVCSETNETQRSKTTDQKHPCEQKSDGFENDHGDLERISSRVWRPSTLLDGENRIILVVDEPGTGKSTLITHLAKKTRLLYPDMWIVRVNINNYTSILHELKTNGFDENGALKILTEAAQIKESDSVQLEKQLFNYIYNSTGNMAVLIDGVDEVGPHYSQEVIQLLRILVKTKIRKIWITSRNFMKGQLEKELQCQSYSLLAFSVEDQKTFLLKFWKQEEDNAKDLAKRVVELSRKYLSDKDKNFMGVPLQCKLLAEMFEENLKQCSTSRKVELPEHINHVMLYDSYVNKKWDIYLAEKKNSDRTKVPVQTDDEVLRAFFLDNHKAAALLAILSTQHFEKLNNKNVQIRGADFLQRIKLGIEKTGIITDITDSKPVFQHRTIAEYFVARWLCDNLQSSQTFMRDHLFESRLDVVRSMVDRILADKCTLHETVLNSNMRHFAKLLNRKESITQKDLGGRTPLHVAISCGNPEIIKLLLKHEADISCEDTFLGLSPLEYATKMNDWQVLSLIMQNRPDIRKQVINEMNPGCMEYIDSALLAAARYGHSDLLRYLLTCVNMAVPGERGRLLHEAARGNHIQTVRTLVNFGASCEIQDENGKTALHVSAEKGSLEVAKFLVERQEMSYGETELEYIVSLDRAITKLNRVNVYDKDGNTPLHLAAAAGKINTLLYLLSAGSNLRSCNTHGEYPLTLAARYGRNETVKILLQSCSVVKSEEIMTSALTAAIVAGHVDTTELLLRSGAPVSGGENEETIHTASRMGHKEIVTLLLQYGSCLTSRTKSGNTPLHFASETGHLSLVKYIVESQRDGLYSLNYEKETPMHLAARNGRDYLVIYFVENGCNINAETASGATCLHLACENGHYTTVDCLLNYGAEVNAMDSADQTPLHIAASRGKTKIVGLLSVHNANFSLQNKDGITALLAASINGHQDTVLFIVQNGGNIEDSDRNGKNIAHYAVANECHDVLKFLSENHENLLHIQNFDGETPLLQALREGRNWIAQYLREEPKGNRTALDDDVIKLIQLSKEQNIPLGKASRYIVEVARYGFVDSLQYFVEMGDDINVKADNGESPLHAACKSGQVATVQYLCEHGALLELQDNNENTALHVAVSNDHLNVTRVLVEKGANLCAADKSGSTALHIAAKGGYLNIVQYLADSFAPIDMLNAKKETALLVATAEGNEKIVRVLIEQGAGIGIQDIEGKTALDIATEKGYTAVTQLLKDRGEGRKLVCFNLDIKSNPRSALHIAVANSHVEEVQRLVEAGIALDCGDPFGRTALWGAAKRGHKSIIRCLLQNGSCVNIPDSEGVTPIDIAVREGHWGAVDEFLMYKPIISPEVTEYLNSQLYEALESGTTQTVQTILKCGISVETTNIYGYTPLHVSANCGHKELLCILLEYGANVNAKEKHGRTPLILSAANGHKDVFRELLNCGASVHIADEYGWTPLHTAAQEGNVQFVRELLKNGANVDITDKSGFTDVYAAARKGNVKVVRKLLKNGAGVDIANTDGETPLCIAARYGYVKVIPVLLEHGARVDHSNNDGETPLYSAARFGHVEVCRMLLYGGATVDIRSKRGATPLHIAALNGHVEVVRILLNYDASVDIANEDGWTPLHEAASKGHSEVVRELLKRGASVDVADNTGWKPLNTAASKGHVEVVREFLKHGASVDTKNADGCTPLNAAAQEGHVDVVRVLLDHGANVYIARNKGWTPLNEAALNGHVEVVRVFLNYGIGIDFLLSRGKTTLYLAAANGHLEVIRELLNHGASRNIVKNNVWLSLHAAAEMGHVEIVRELLKYGVAVDVTNEDGWTPLNRASRCGHLEVVRELLNHGANVDTANKDGRTPLNEAAQEGHVEIVQELLKRRASVDVDITTEGGWTHLKTAARCGHLEVGQMSLDQRAGVDIANTEGATTLITAASEGNVEHVKIFANHDATIDIGDKGGFTSVNAAAQSVYGEIGRDMLNQGVSVDRTNTDGCPPLYAAAQEGRVEVVRDLLNLGASADTTNTDGCTPLYAAAQEGHVEVVRELLNHKASVDIANNEGATPLMRAASEGDVEFVRIFLNHGATLDIRDKSGFTPLNVAAQRGYVDVVEELLNRGANMNIGNENGAAPLNTAALNGHVEIILKLLEHGAGVDIADNEGCTPLYAATKKGHVRAVRELLNRGAKVDIATKEGFTPLYSAASSGHVAVVRELLKHGANMNIGNENGAAPLNTAALNGHVEIILKLLEHGARVDTADNEGCTPLYAATIKGHVRAVRELLNRGAKVDIATKEGFTPLYSAASSGHVAVVRELLKHGANLDISKESGLSLFIAAAKRGHLEVIRVLLTHALGENISKSCIWKRVKTAADKGDIKSIRNELDRISCKYFAKKSQFPESLRKYSESWKLLALPGYSTH